MPNISRKTLVAAFALLLGTAAFGLSGWSENYQVSGLGWEGHGAGVATADLDGNGRPDMVVLAYDNPAGANTFRYKIGWNIDRYGRAASWSGAVEVPGVGHEGQGADIFFAGLDSDPRPDMILMAYDNPTGANTFRYKIGWNIDSTGMAGSWSGVKRVPGVGHEGQGAGLYVLNLDANPRPDLVVVAYDNPSGANTFRYKIGWNLNRAGNASAWSSVKQVDGVGHEGQGAGVYFTNLDNNPRPEMILMAYDNPAGANTFRYKVGWNVSPMGNAASWSKFVTVPGVGHEGQGAGILVADLNDNRSLDMVLLAYDNPAQANTFRYRIGWDMVRVSDFLVALDSLGHNNFKAPSQIPNSHATQTAANLYQLSDPVVLQTAYEAVQDYVNDCRNNPAGHNSEMPTDTFGNPLMTPEYVGFFDVLNHPDLTVAAVAWYVDRNMRWTNDGLNSTILNTNFALNYQPGWDFPIPANYTIKYTGDAAWGGTPARFHGDCEDFAILRAALLRSLGFNPEHIWNAIDNRVTHEYNLVVYRGAFRIMDYGPIDSWLSNHTWDAHQTHYGYCETHGYRGTGAAQHTDLVSCTTNYPGGGPECSAWSHHTYYQAQCP